MGMPGDVQLAARAVEPEIRFLDILKLSLVECEFIGGGGLFVEELPGLGLCVLGVYLKFPE